MNKNNEEFKFTEDEEHFVFSTLNTLSYYCRKDSAEARKIVLYLSDYMRLMFNKENIVEAEILFKALKAYGCIQAIRFQNNLKVEFKIDELEIAICKEPVKIIIEFILYFLTRKNINNCHIYMTTQKINSSNLNILLNLPEEYFHIIIKEMQKLVEYKNINNIKFKIDRGIIVVSVNLN